ncbi:unnamed protein product, partial [Polarella glacialis]
LELHAGAGVLGLSLLGVLPAGARLLSTDVNPRCAEAFRANAQCLGLESRAAFEAADELAAAGLAEKGRFRIVIVDPPRRGLGKEVIARLAATGSVEALLYLSCNPTSFQSDAEQLLGFGFRLQDLRSYDSFPGTEHLE